LLPSSCAAQLSDAALDWLVNSEVITSTSRVRRHCERRRNGLRLFTVTVPETVIENAVARGLLAADDRAGSRFVQ
jgi:hypothetical protein